MQIEIFLAPNVFFPFRAELTTGGGWCRSFSPKKSLYRLHILHCMNSTYSFLWTPQISLLTKFFMSKTQIQQKLPFMDSTKVLVSTLKIRPGPATHRAPHTVGRGGHFICRRNVFYNGKNTKFTIKHFPSKPGGHFLEARRAFFCPRQRV